MIELCWWETGYNNAVHQFTLEVDERELEKMEMVLLNGAEVVANGAFKLRRLNSKE